MKSLIKSLAPVVKTAAGTLSRRFGTAVAAFVVGLGVAEPTASAALVAVTAAGGLVFDVLVALAVKRLPD